MNVAAFVVLAAMLTAYVMLDGYDLGVGAVHLWFSKTERGRAASFAAIKPFWNGNEVFLIAAGAALFALFPKVYAAAFSGFYLPFIIVLWLLMIRGMSIELRGYFTSDIWNGFWDVAFWLSSALLVLFFGVALGNIVRGVPLDTQGYFAGTFTFLLNGYALSVGALALTALSMNGATFLWMRLDPDLRPRAQTLMRALWPVVLLLFIGVTVETIAAHPIGAHVGLWIAPAVALAALIAVYASKRAGGALAASSAFLAALMASAAQTIFPFLLPAFRGGGLDIYNAAPNAYSVGTALTVTIIGVGAALCYGTIAAYRMMRA
ncbi:MAG TPA: cytochrome d ubiquinol oxidase subunit II [Candidatus Baltobacteraceae bacterium]|jgi:cytochrome d ubiquinol oxidase subunit II|nr:cytochrome d ubiquinol oxidase subunit II [Candidatus Baltobacteraceae bacterium]